MAEPTGQDALLYTQLLAITQTEHHARARRWVQFDFDAGSYRELEQKYPPGSEERDRLVVVMGFYESAGVLVSRGLLHEDVFFDAPYNFDTVWPKLKAIVSEWQAAAEDPAVWENFNWLGLRYDAWLRERWQSKLEMIPPDRSPARPEPHVRGFSHSRGEP